MLRRLTFIFFFFSLFFQAFIVHGGYSTSYVIAPLGTNCLTTPTVSSTSGKKGINDSIIYSASQIGSYTCSEKGYYDGVWSSFFAQGTSYVCPANRYAGAISYLGSSFSVFCMLEDSVTPSLSTISYTTGRRNSDLSITVQGQDNAMLDKIEIYEYRSGIWQLLHTWNNLGYGNALYSNTYVKTVENGLDTRYFARVYDRVGRTLDSAVGGDVHFDTDIPTNLDVTYPTGRKNSPVTITYQARDARKLKRIELWENNGVTWNLVDFADNLNSVNTLVTRTWTRTAVEGPTYSYRVVAYDETGNQATYTNPGILRFDTTPPAEVDISFNPALTQPLLATDTQSISIPVSTNGGSPIDTVEARFENWASVDNYLPLSTGPAPLVINASVQDVDSERGVNGGRSYRLLVTRVCDQAGNCLNNPFSGAPREYFVYANANTLNQGGANKRVTLNQLQSVGNIADATTRNLTVLLNDKYGNDIVTASGMGRQINLTFNVLNRLYLDQYQRSGSGGVFVTLANDTNFQPRFALGDTVSQVFSNQNSTNGLYVYGFQVYSPTYQNSLADPLGQFTIQDIRLDVTGSVGAISNELIDNSANIDFNFAPLYRTILAGDIRTDGFLEGVVGSNSLTVQKAVSGVTPSARDIFLEFGSGAREIHPSLNLKIGSNPLPSTNVTEGWQSNIDSVSRFINGFSEISYNLFTKLTQENGVPVSLGLKSYLSTHISYVLNGNRVVYNSDIVGKNNYFEDTILNDNSNQVGVKIIGITASNKQNELLQNQFTQDVAILGNVYKTTVKKDVVSNVYSLIKSVTPLANGTTITDLVNFQSNPSGTKLAKNSILYYGNLNGARIDLGDGNEQIDGVKTIIIVGGDLYIRNNMYYQNKSEDILGVIVLKDENGKGGNLYVDPSVTNIVGTYLLDKAVISYDGTNELGGNTAQSVLKNQLHIFGNVFSENTLGGSRASPLKCPYYISSCTQDEAQKYDLNFLRRYILNLQGVPVGVGKVIGGGNCTDVLTKDCVGGNAAFVRNILNVATDPYARYPVVIEYNPLISKVYPPLFSKK